MDVATAILSWVQPVWNFMILAGILSGFIMAGLGLYKVATSYTHNDGRVNKQGANIGWMGVIFGVFLINIKTVLDTLSMSIFNQASQNGISYSGGGGGQYAEIIHAAFAVISLVGLYGILSGLHMLKPNEQPSREFWHGVRRLTGGTLAVNIVPTLTFFGASLGGTMQSVITKLIG